jgi:hypothetical protein
MNCDSPIKHSFLNEKDICMSLIHWFEKNGIVANRCISLDSESINYLKKGQRKQIKSSME